jgi:hypothetical protein
MQDVTASNRFESSIATMHHPAPRAAKRSVFSGLERFTTLRLFNFRGTFADLFLQFKFQVSNIFFKTDDPLLGTRRRVDLPLSKSCVRRSSCNNRLGPASEQPSIATLIDFDPRHALETQPQQNAIGHRTTCADVDDPCDGLLVGRCTYQICPTIYGSLSLLKHVYRLESILLEPRRAAVTKVTSCSGTAERALARYLGRRGAIAKLRVYERHGGLRKLPRRPSAARSRSRWSRR